MALIGLQFTTWTGCLFGIIVLRVPWGAPSLPSWFSFFPIYSVLNLAFSVFNMVDVYVNSQTSFSLAETNQLAKWTTSASVQIHTAFFFFFRFYFLLRAKQLAKFMNELYFYPLPKLSPFWRKMAFIETIYSATGYMTHFLAVIISMVGMKKAAEAMYNQAAVTWVGYITGNKYLYTIIFLSVCVIVQGVAENTTCTYLLYFSHKLSRILENFANEAVEIIETEMKSLNNCHSVRDDDMANANLKLQCAKHTIITKFRKVESLCNQFYHLLGPLFLSLIALGTGSAIVSTSKAMILPRSGVMLSVDVIRIIGYVCYIGVYEIGDRLNKVTRKVKLQLYQSFIKVSWQMEFKQEVKEIVEIVGNWEWEMSAFKFFSVERRLAGGVS